MKILIITPEIHRLGGVANHYLGLQPHWSLDVDYSYCGKRNEKESIVTTLCYYIYDYIRFFFKVSKYDVVVINPSLRRFQIFRDSIYIKIAKLFNRKVVTFIHGFDENFYESLREKPKRFSATFNYSSLFFVLFSDYGEKLKLIGIKSPILKTTTKVSETFTTAINHAAPRNSIKNLLFVGRLIKEKGIRESLDMFALLSKRHPDVSFCICGDGPELNYIKRIKNKDVIHGKIRCPGMLVGRDLAEEYSKGDILILLSYSEGLATCVLEAMAFGLVIITTPVGGIQDFFKNGKMGYLVDKDDLQGIISKIEYLSDNPNIIQDISIHNKEYARKHFMASAVAKKIESDIIRFCSNISKQ